MLVSSYGCPDLGCLKGLGANPISTVGAGTAAVGGVLFSSPALMTALGISTAAGPIGLAIVGLVAAGAAIAGALGVGQGCGATCIQATQIVNNAAPLFQANLDGYENGQIDQATAQANFNQMWNAIKQACGGIAGAAGTNCISDRQQGACKWNQTGQPQYPGQPANGACWNWYEAYYTPLTLPPVNAPAQSVLSMGGSTPINIGGFQIDSTVLVIGGVTLVGLIMAGSN